MNDHDQGFDQQFEALATIAHRVAYRILGNRSDAEEVAQEALARAYARWRSVGPHAEPWVARVASNLAIDRWRRRPALPLDPSAVGGHAGAVEDGTGLALERHGLVAALTRLPKRQREVVVLRYLADLPEQEVAEQLGTSVGSVKQHAHRATARLRRDLAGTGLEREVVPDVRALR
jgi:RNA polymerase sigma-70 factor (ECF subfamily)